MSPFAPASALVHLSRPPRSGRTGEGGEGTRYFEALVPAAAIDDDQLVRRAPSDDRNSALASFE